MRVIQKGDQISRGWVTIYPELSSATSVQGWPSCWLVDGEKPERRGTESDDADSVCFWHIVQLNEGQCRQNQRQFRKRSK